MPESLTLYDIETDLLNLMLCREAALDDSEMRPALRDEAVKQIDLAIRERISNEIQKVDGIAFYLREFAARAAAAKAEKDRLAARQRMWEAREERLKEIVTGVMLMTGKKRLEGDSNTLRLQKCPASVEIGQLGMVPDEYLKATVTMPLELWNLVLELIENAKDEGYGAAPCIFKQIAPVMASVKLDASKSKIAEALKRGDGVPGCSLVTDKMSLRVE
jgi:Gp157 protein